MLRCCGVAAVGIGIGLRRGIGAFGLRSGIAVVVPAAVRRLCGCGKAVLIVVGIMGSVAVGAVDIGIMIFTVLIAAVGVPFVGAFLSRLLCTDIAAVSCFACVLGFLCVEVGRVVGIVEAV